MVSVCMATFNGGKFIHNQLSTILNQLKNDDEIIISDDGSTDNTLNIISHFNDHRIKVVKGPCEKNPVRNFENALNYASGQYIFLSDQDDMWEQDKIVKCINLLSDFDLVITDAKIIDDKDNIIFKSFFKEVNSRKGILKNIRKNSYIGACICFKANSLKYILPFPKNIPMHDSWIGLCTEVNGKVFFSNEKLVLYRRHDQNMTTAPFQKSKYSILKKLKFRVQMILMVFIAYKRKLDFNINI